MVRPARLAFPGSTENPAGLVDAVVLAVAAGVLGLEVLGETVTRRQPQARAGQVVRARGAASWALPGQLKRPGRASPRRVRRRRRPGDQVRGRPGHGDGLFPGYPRDLAIAAGDTRNGYATCVRIIKSSTWLPVVAAGAVTFIGSSAGRCELLSTAAQRWSLCDRWPGRPAAYGSTGRRLHDK
jgi:hypothetical protein